LPYAFTEYGTIMVASVLNTPRAVEMSIFIVRAFVNLRTYFIQHKELSLKVNELEVKIGKHDELIVNIVNAIKQLMEPSKPKNK